MKNKIFLALVLIILVISITFSLTACNEESTSDVSNKKSSSITESDNTTISFEQLQEMAVEPNYTTPYEYSISGEELEYDYDSFNPINCLGSKLAIATKDNEPYLLNYTFNPMKVISSSIYSSGLNAYNYYYTFSSYNGVYYCSNLPIVIYSRYSNNSTYVYYLNPYGTIIYKETVSSVKCFNALILGTYNDGYTYFVIYDENGGDDIYFKYMYTDSEAYSVETTTEEELAAAKTTIVDPTQYETPEYLDGLTEYYDSQGNIISYLYIDNNIYYIYDLQKHFLNSIDISSYGYSSSSKNLRLEKKMYFFKNEEYYESELNKGSEATYKCEYLAIDLETGSVSYDEDYKYYITSCTNKTEDDKFKYAYVKFYELNEKGEQSDVLKCAILINDLDLDDAFAYDGITTSVYKIDDDTMLTKFGSEWFVVTSTERTLLNGISINYYFENGDVIYTNQDGKYYLCKLKYILSSIKEMEDGYDFISTTKYNGEYASYYVDYNNGKYYSGDYELNSQYYSYSKQGIIITNDAIIIGDNQVLSFDDLILGDINYFVSYDDTIIYKLTLYDELTYSSSVKYLKVTKTLTNEEELLG